MQTDNDMAILTTQHLMFGWKGGGDFEPILNMLLDFANLQITTGH